MQESHEKSEGGAEKGKKTKAMEAAMHRQEQSRSREGKGQTETQETQTERMDGTEPWDVSLGEDWGSEGSNGIS